MRIRAGTSYFCARTDGELWSLGQAPTRCAGAQGGLRQRRRERPILPVATRNGFESRRASKSSQSEAIEITRLKLDNLEDRPRTACGRDTARMGA